MPMCEVGMPSEAAKSGPSGMTIMKSSTLTNWIAPTSTMMSRSETTGGVAVGAAGSSVAITRCF
jgi:hypothetical protein